MNREPTSLLLFAAAGAFLAGPAIGQEAPSPSIAIEAIEARNLLAPAEPARSNRPGYRLDPGLQSASGQRAKLSVDVGDATLFAITGRLTQQSNPYGPLDAGHARALSQRRETGKVYGGGVSRSFGAIDVSATYQYSKTMAEQFREDSQVRDDGPGKSHSLRGGLRVRFRP